MIFKDELGYEIFVLMAILGTLGFLALTVKRIFDAKRQEIALLEMIAAEAAKAKKAAKAAKAAKERHNGTA